MQRFINSSISVRRNRFSEKGAKFQDIQFSMIDIGKSLDSINNSMLSFTNYANSDKQKVYSIVEKLYLKVKNSESDLFDDYQPDELYYNGKAIDRLLDIINDSNKLQYTKTDLLGIYKLKHRNEPKLHLYIKVDNDSVLILLIDLFHLSLPADVYANGRLIKRTGLNDLSGIYLKFKDNIFNLNNILKNNNT